MLFAVGWLVLLAGWLIVSLDLDVLFRTVCLLMIVFGCWVGLLVSLNFVCNSVGDLLVSYCVI